MLVAVDAMDFHFESTCTTPYMSAPSSPRRFGHGGGDYYFSAPTSPARASAIYQEFNNSTQRFNWDESIIENSKSRDTHDEEEEDDEDVDFAFDFGVQLDSKTSVTADELFHGGKIKPLSQPQTQTQTTTNRFSQIDYDEFNKSRNRKSPISSPRSPTHQGKKIHPFNNKPPMRGEEQDRGRGRTMTSSSSKSNRRESRSLSPLRIAEFAWEEEQQQQQQLQQQSSKPTSANDAAVIASSGSLKGSKKWSFKDLLLFRSASEGRASDKDPLRKYTAAAAMATTKRSTNEGGGDEKNGSSFRSTDNNPGSRKKGPVSAHELHYKVNRAVSEESRRKTYLPYKPRLFGFLGFNPAVNSQRF